MGSGLSQISHLLPKSTVSDSTLSVEVRSEKKQAILESLRAGVNVSLACKAAQIDRRTFYHWQTSDPTFANEVKVAKIGRVESVKDIAYECALKSIEDPRYQTSLIAWMNNEGGWGKSSIKNAYQNNVQVYVPENGRGNSTLTDCSSMTDEELTKAILDVLIKEDKKLLLGMLGIAFDKLPKEVQESLR